MNTRSSILLIFALTAIGGHAATLQFSGETWIIKSSQGRVGPGPNYFSSMPQNVRVDEMGRLRLAITREKGRWQCAEVISSRSFGYGTYRFHLESAVDGLDPNVVLGLFTWNDAPEYNHREIDIEFARWGDPKNLNAQYVIQPYNTPGNIHRWLEPPGLVRTIHSFQWTRTGIHFQSIRGDTGQVLQTWTYSGRDIPVPGGENARMNLWLFRGQAPLNRQNMEVIVSRFEFIPLQ